MLYGPDGPVGDWHEVRNENVRLQPDLNTRISAVGFAKWMGEPDVPGYFVHNVHATNPIPPEMLDPCPQLVYDSKHMDTEGTHIRLAWRNLG